MFFRKKKEYRPGGLDRIAADIQRKYSSEAYQKYPEFEKDLRYRIDGDLDYQLSRILYRSPLYEFSNEPNTTITPSNFIHDGFYPYYTVQDVKILFIGREAYQMDANNYIDVMFPQIQSGVTRRNANSKGKPIDEDPFYAAQMYIAYSILHDCMPYEQVPWAKDFCSSFGTENGISFAFMNMNKFSSWSNTWNTNWELMDAYIETATNDNTNHIEDEICNLKPDIIISMGFEYDRLTSLGGILTGKLENSSSITNVHHLTMLGQMIPVLDTYHFSKPGKLDAICKDVIARAKEELGL